MEVSGTKYIAYILKILLNIYLTIAKVSFLC